MPQYSDYIIKVNGAYYCGEDYDRPNGSNYACGRGVFFYMPVRPSVSYLPKFSPNQTDAKVMIGLFNASSEIENLMQSLNDAESIEVIKV